jgi:Family of unknown function (DUF6882)
MDAAEAARMRREILGDVAPLLREDLAAAAWGRLLVEVVRGASGEPLVAGIDVEEVGDEGRVDQVFGGERARSLLPTLAKVVEALCALHGTDLAEVRGGTFVRLEGDRFGWLPALVHAPSALIDRERDALVARLREKNEVLAERFGPPREVDLTQERMAFAPASRSGVSARATLIGTFAPSSRTWGWGGSNPHVPDSVRRASAALADGIFERDLWELSTPAFATDEPTAWALAAFVCDRVGGDAVFCGPERDGLVFVLVRDLPAS